MKAGTSSLHAWMNLHPELAMSRTKELDFFTHSKAPLGGLRRYRWSFPNEGAIAGESSVNYSKSARFPGVPERMARVVPRAKLIYVLRDPLQRTLSHYRHNLSHGRERRVIEDALTDFPSNNYVVTSRYHEQLLAFLKHYARHQVHLVDFATMRDDPARVMHDVFDFLGVDATFTHADFGKVHHASSNKGRPNRLGATIATVPYLRHLRYALPAVFEAPLDRPQLPGDVRDALLEHFRSDVDALRAESGLALESWSV
ncbi:MAG: hypothetical protein ACI82G_000609 [Bradymonadia bacterium]|jgi:hypothetical protein